MGRISPVNVPLEARTRRLAPMGSEISPLQPRGEDRHSSLAGQILGAKASGSSALAPSPAVSGCHRLARSALPYARAVKGLIVATNSLTGRRCHYSEALDRTPERSTLHCPLPPAFAAPVSPPGTESCLCEHRQASAGMRASSLIQAHAVAFRQRNHQGSMALVSRGTAGQGRENVCTVV